MSENKTDINYDNNDLLDDGLEIFENQNTQIKDKKDDSVVLSKSKLVLIRKLLENIKENNEKLMQLLSATISEEEEARISIGQITDSNISSEEIEETGAKIIEGVFDGENMIGPDGKQYSMPANYASKSKLVEGDIMKLTIMPNGTFVYKQIGPIERSRLVGILENTGTGYVVNVSGKKWKVLTASVTYFKGKDKDEVIILVPKTGDSKWAAVENIVRNQ